MRSSECKRDKDRIGEGIASSAGVDGNKNPPDISEAGEEESKPELDASDAVVSVRARVKRSDLALAAAGMLSAFDDCATGSDRALSGPLKSRRLTGGCTASFRTSDFVDIEGRVDCVDDLGAWRLSGSNTAPCPVEGAEEEVTL